jgi:hypothetical protein
MKDIKPTRELKQYLKNRESLHNYDILISVETNADKEKIFSAVCDALDDQETWKELEYGEVIDYGIELKEEEENYKSYMIITDKDSGVDRFIIKIDQNDMANRLNNVDDDDIISNFIEYHYGKIKYDYYCIEDMDVEILTSDKIDDYSSIE